jgi:hypothetical protein
VRLGAREGQLVVAEITEPPTRGRPPFGRILSVLGDNWLDVSSIIAQRSLGLLDDQLDCESRAKSLTPAFYSRQLFSSNTRQKIVVGLTDGLYAVTDGLHAQYFNHYNSVDSVASPNVWPIEIEGHRKGPHRVLGERVRDRFSLFFCS